MRAQTLLALAALAGLGALVAYSWTTAKPSEPLPPCVCGHDAKAHGHNRRGTDCALCPRTGPDACRAYEPTRRPPPQRPASMLDLLELHAQRKDLDHAITLREAARRDAALGRVPVH